MGSQSTREPPVTGEMIAAGAKPLREFGLAPELAEHLARRVFLAMARVAAESTKPAAPAASSGTAPSPIGQPERPPGR